MNVGIYIYQNAEVLDFSGPFEVFSTASRLSNPENIFNVFLIAEESLPVSARGGFIVTPHYTVSSHPDIDVLVVAGGIHTAEVKKEHIVRWVSQVSRNARVVASVCTGAFILARTGLLSGIQVTTHWEDIDDLRQTHQDLIVVDSRRWVDEGKYVTSGGISAGIDMSLHLVARLTDQELAERTARQMEFTWQKNS